ncbi:MAG TPA: Gmad2 immunoglobulin-like domain-containing protein, partial [Acidimicrobiales bacterium]|nr:Gmad2 immunoglobulin-like domain-containing protein [Acidimicrobiales bacterium]
TLHLTRVGEGGPWTVTDARTPGIVVRSPERGAFIASPTPLEGSAWAFEGHVRVEVRDEGMGAGSFLGESFVTGGGDQLRPFSGRVTFRPATAAAGAIVFTEPSVEDGSTISATVLRVHFGRTEARAGLDDRSTLRLDGVGPITYGMTVAEARAAAGTPLRESALPACTALAPVASPKGLDLLVPEGDRVRYALVKDAPIVTAEGIGTRSRESEVVKAYPEAEVRNPGEQVHRIVRFGSGALASFVMVFEIQNGVVASMFSGPRDAANRRDLQLNRASASFGGPRATMRW